MRVWHGHIGKHRVQCTRGGDSDNESESESETKNGCDVRSQRPPPTDPDDPPPPLQQRLLHD